MIRHLSSRFIAAAVLAAAALGATSAAQARPDIQVSIGLPGLPIFLPLPPGFARTEPMIVQPQPVFVAPPGFAYGRAWGPSYRPDFERERAWRHAEWQRREWERREWERRELEQRRHDRSWPHGHGRD